MDEFSTSVEFPSARPLEFLRVLRIRLIDCLTNLVPFLIMEDLRLDERLFASKFPDLLLLLLLLAENPKPKGTAILSFSIVNVIFGWFRI